MKIKIDFWNENRFFALKNFATKLGRLRTSSCNRTDFCIFPMTVSTSCPGGQVIRALRSRPWAETASRTPRSALEARAAEQMRKRRCSGMGAEFRALISLERAAGRRGLHGISCRDNQQYNVASPQWGEAARHGRAASASSLLCIGMRASVNGCDTLTRNLFV